MAAVKILIADHEEESLNHLGQVLERAGYQVERTPNGKDAWKIAQRLQPAICVIDPMVSGVDGFTLSQQLRRKFPKLKIIISTAIYKGDRYRRDAKTKYGASAYLEKPYSDEALLRLVARFASATRKRETQPGMPLPDLDLDQTVGVASGDMSAHIRELENQLLLKPKDSSSLIDDLELDFDISGDESSVPSAEPIPAPEPTSVPVEPETVDVLQKATNDPNAHLDKTVADSFAKLEQSAQERANEKRTAYKPSDTLISGEVAADFRLTSEEIFGGLIVDIESGRDDKPPGAKPIGKVKKADDITLPDQEPGFEGVGEDTNPNLAPLRETPPHSPDRTSKYELLELIDEDQAFEVWKAKIKGEKGFERIMAVKKIKDFLTDNLELNTLFLKEAKLAAALSHHNIVQIYELGEIDGARFLAREFLPGESLASILRRCRDQDATLPAPLTAHLAAKVADALAYAHEARGMSGDPLNIVHHHLSPDNIIVTDEGDLKVLNFGTGRIAARAVGTEMVPLDQLQCLAPEQAGGDPLDHRVDLFALGSLMYRCLTGLDPFTGTGRDSVMMRIREATTAPVHMIRSDIPQDLSDIVAKAMQGDLNQRYQKAETLAADLRGFLKKNRRRVSDQDVGAFLRSLRAGVVLEAPSALPPTPGDLFDQMAPESFTASGGVLSPANQDAPSGEEVAPPPVRRQTPPPPQKGGKGPILLVAVVLVFLVALLLWKFVLPQSSPGTTTVPAQTAPQTPEPVQPDPDLGSPDDSVEPVDTTDSDESLEENPGLEPADVVGAPPEPGAAGDPAATTDGTEAAAEDDELRQMEELLERRRKELEALNNQLGTDQKDN